MITMTCWILDAASSAPGAGFPACRAPGFAPELCAPPVAAAPAMVVVPPVSLVLEPGPACAAPDPLRASGNRWPEPHAATTAARAIAISTSRRLPGTHLLFFRRDEVCVRHA